MNRVHIQPTIFQNYPEGRTTYGYRAYDDCDQSYDNTWDSIPDNDLSILEKVWSGSMSDITGDLLDFVALNRTGIYIGDNWHEWKEIEPVLKDGG